MSINSLSLFIFFHSFAEKEKHFVSVAMLEDHLFLNFFSENTQSFHQFSKMAILSVLSENMLE